MAFLKTLIWGNRKTFKISLNKWLYFKAVSFRWHERLNRCCVNASKLHSWSHDHHCHDFVGVNNLINFTALSFRYTSRVSDLMSVLRDLNKGNYQRTMVSSQSKEENAKQGAVIKLLFLLQTASSPSLDSRMGKQIHDKRSTEWAKVMQAERALGKRHLSPSFLSARSLASVSPSLFPWLARPLNWPKRDSKQPILVKPFIA